MFFDKDVKIEQFIMGLAHPAAIRFCDGEHIVTNAKWKQVVSSVEHIKLKEIYEKTTDEFLKTNIRYCMQCDEDALVALEPSLNYELFDGNKYLTNRTAISYKNKKALLIIAVELD